MNYKSKTIPCSVLEKKTTAVPLLSLEFVLFFFNHHVKCLQWYCASYVLRILFTCGFSRQTDPPLDTHRQPIQASISLELVRLWCFCGFKAPFTRELVQQTCTANKTSEHARWTDSARMYGELIQWAWTADRIFAKWDIQWSRDYIK